MVFVDMVIDVCSFMDKNNKKDVQGIDSVQEAIVLNQIQRESQEQKNIKKILFFSKSMDKKS